MALTLEYDSNAPGVTIERIRSDFEAIWKQNINEVQLIKKVELQAGDYFHEGESEGTTSTNIWLNIQGSSSDSYDRKNYGVTTVGRTFHAYARWYEVIANLDVIVFQDEKFIVKNHNKSIHNGEVGFQQFDMFKFDNG